MQSPACPTWKDPPACVRRDVPLAPRTTLGVGGAAAYFAAPQDAAELAGVLQGARRAGVPVLPLGGGSNVVVADAGFAGLVLTLPPTSVAAVAAQLDAAAAAAADGDDAVVWLPGAAPWDATCRAATAAGLAGLEALVGIPGTFAAAPLQNVGAYGQELGDVLVAIEASALHGGETRRLAAAELGLGYRTSHLKQAWRGRYVVTRVAVRLARRRAARRWPSYAGLRAALGGGVGAGQAPPPIADVAACVLALRRQKSMLLDAADPNSRSAGSFFVNPTVAAAQAQALRRDWPALPTWPVAGSAGAGAGADAVKLPAAWLIEQAGYRRGHAFAEAGGRVGLSQHHALALVNRGGARAADVVAAAAVVRRAVAAQFAVQLQPEPQFVGFAAEAVAAAGCGEGGRRG